MKNLNNFLICLLCIGLAQVLYTVSLLLSNIFIALAIFIIFKPGLPKNLNN